MSYWNIVKHLDLVTIKFKYKWNLENLNAVLVKFTNKQKHSHNEMQFDPHVYTSFCRQGHILNRHIILLHTYIIQTQLHGEVQLYPHITYYILHELYTHVQIINSDLNPLTHINTKHSRLTHGRIKYSRLTHGRIKHSWLTHGKILLIIMSLSRA